MRADKHEGGNRINVSPQLRRTPSDIRIFAKSQQPTCE